MWRKWSPCRVQGAPAIINPLYWPDIHYKQIMRDSSIHHYPVDLPVFTHYSSYKCSRKKTTPLSMLHLSFKLIFYFPNVEAIIIIFANQNTPANRDFILYIFNFVQFKILLTNLHTFYWIYWWLSQLLPWQQYAIIIRLFYTE